MMMISVGVPNVSNNANGGGPCIYDLSTETKFIFISYNAESDTFSIRILEGGYCDGNDYSTTTPIKNGTILEDMFKW